MIDEAQLVPYHTTPLPCAEGPWLVFAPHADDESFGMGGTLALASAAGIAVHLVVATDGALGGQQTDLVSVRRQEAARAAEVLGAASLAFLNQPDRGLQVSTQVLAEISALIARHQPMAVFFPGVLELHPDHRACALAVWQALRSDAARQAMPISYEISGQSPANCLVDITSVIERKKQAIAVYQSQLGQNNYLDIVLALNRLRTFTLSAETGWAEAFYCFSQAELAGSLADWLEEKCRRVLA